ncbi:hypothetical protein GCM10009785_19920 [Brooklawnia cerclae]|uniref:Transcriptional regulator with XRE-family HTH domain n=1 Tax=Brooklawnia cerclae TaxID=349934 RepID=A0ABX0SKP8_9ACTN|nr:helix-turn-helix domain-containing protein [Brooklawnia cerclae]NIH57266.1 transcriptional regulator with XRE-family HTH domain [Brooklawnia cerclae]
MSKPNIRIRQDRVALLRQMRELDTDYALAKAMGMSQGNVSRTLRNKQSPGPRFIAGICVALGATQNDLFEVVDNAA